jgi:hypothetical protein
MSKITFRLEGTLRLADKTQIARIENTLQFPEITGNDPIQRMLEQLQALLDTVGKLGDHTARQTLYQGSHYWQDQLPSFEAKDDGQDRQTSGQGSGDLPLPSPADDDTVQ